MKHNLDISPKFLKHIEDNIGRTIQDLDFKGDFNDMISMARL